MKRLSGTAKLRLRRCARKRAIRRAHRRNKKVAIRRFANRTRVKWFNKYGSGTTTAAKRILLPQNFCLEQNYEPTAEILAEMRKVLSTSLSRHYQGVKFRKRPGKMESFFDFVPVKRISPAAALIVASEYDRSRALVDWSIPLINQDKWSPAVTATLGEIGFFSLLAIAVPANAGAKSAVEIVPFMAGDSVSGDDALKLATTLADMVFADMPEDADEASIAARMKVYGPLVEAIENTILHAYTPGYDGLVVKRWWMTGAVNPTERHVNIVVYDQGQSIPATLPGWSEWPWIERHLSRFHRRWSLTGDQQGIDDAAKLRLAMDAPRSSTGHSNRGKGFPAFKEVLAGCKKGSLRIISRRGEFLMEAKQKPVSRALKTPLTGTLVEWDLWL